jgi:heme/copper-type cytochrome/quinol oxidase subunit 2
MKYRDKTILVFLAIIISGTYPTVNAYMANMSLIPQNTVTITASRYNFDVVGKAKVGQPTKVVAFATDVTHAAFIKELGVNLACLPGPGGTTGRENSRIIVPQKAGTYKIKCVEYCGELHGNMSTDMAGEFIVED